MGTGQSSQKHFHQFKKLRKEQALKEMKSYRDGYPESVDDPNLTDNYRFYLNEVPCRPDALFIDEIFRDWSGNYDVLELNHNYIQWLFPTRSKGSSRDWQPLQLHEAKKIQEDPMAQDRVLRSYKMMLDFFGIELLDETKGIVDKAPHWEERFLHLNRTLHNSMRITRILKSLGELGFEHLKYPLVEFLLKQVLKERTLSGLQESLLDYWVHTLRSDNDRRFLLCVAEAVLDKFVPDVSKLLDVRKTEQDQENERNLLRRALVPANQVCMS